MNSKIQIFNSNEKSLISLIVTNRFKSVIFCVRRGLIFLLVLHISKVSASISKIRSCGVYTSYIFI